MARLRFAPLVLVLLHTRAEAAVELGRARVDGSRTEYPQVVQGMAVAGHGIVQLRTQGGHLLTRAKLAASIPTFAPTLKAPDAAQALLSQGLGRSTQVLPLRIASVPGLGLRPLWRVRGPIQMVPQLSQKQYDVDAETGAILGARELFLHVVSADIFPSNPRKSPTLERTVLAVQPSQPGQLAAPELVADNCVDKGNLRTVFNESFRACELVQSATPDSDGNYSAAPDDDANSPTKNSDPYAQVSMFAHSARAYSFFRALRGEPGAQTVATAPLNVVSNIRFDPNILALFNGRGNGGGSTSTASTPLSPLDNAFFYADDNGGFFSQLLGVQHGGLFFGQGENIDYAYDGDVVYHEFTHAVVDHSLQLGGDYVEPWGYSVQPGAMNEGLADYFSSAITGDPDLGEYAGGWDSGGTIRTLNNNFTCNENVGGESHYDSQLFSGGLWSTRKALASDSERAQFDAAVYTAMRLHPGSEHLAFHEFVEMVRDVLRTELPAAEPLLLAEMTRRGVLPACEPMTILEPGVEVVGPDVSPSFSAYFAPGRRESGLSLTPGVTQFKAAVDARAGYSLQLNLGWYDPTRSGDEPLKLIVRFDAPIAWERQGSRYTHNGTAFDIVGGSNTSVLVAVPQGATTAYMQIANTSNETMYYGKLSVSSVAPPRKKADAGSRDASGDGGRGLGLDDEDSVSLGGGGGCNTLGEGATSMTLYAALALALARLSKRVRTTHASSEPTPRA